MNRISSSHAQWLNCCDTSYTWYYLNRHATLLPGVTIRTSFRSSPEKKPPGQSNMGSKVSFCLFLTMIVTCSCWSPQSIRFISSSSHNVFPWFVYLGKQAGFIWQLPVKIKKHLDYDLANWFYFKNVFVFQAKTLIYFFFKNILPLHLFDHIVVESYGMSKCILPRSQKSKSGLEDNFPTFECQPLKRLSLDRASSADREAIHPMCWQTVSIFCPILQPKPTNI